MGTPENKNYLITNEHEVMSRANWIAEAIRKRTIQVPDGYTYVAVGNVIKTLATVSRLFHTTGLVPDTIVMDDINPHVVDTNRLLLANPDMLQSAVRNRTSLLQTANREFEPFEAEKTSPDSFSVSLGSSRAMNIKLSHSDITTLDVDPSTNIHIVDWSNLWRWVDLSKCTITPAFTSAPLHLVSDFSFGPLLSQITQTELNPKLREFAEVVGYDDQSDPRTRSSLSRMQSLIALATTDFNTIRTASGKVKTATDTST